MSGRPTIGSALRVWIVLRTVALLQVYRPRMNQRMLMPMDDTDSSSSLNRM